MHELVAKAARRFRERLQQELGQRLLELKVFGSRARGDAHGDSDLDILVLVDGDEHLLLRPVAAVATEVMRELELPFSISPLVLDRPHLESLQRREVRLAEDLAREGISL